MEHRRAEAVVADVTRAKGRKTLYHFTRGTNLPAMARRDALLSSYTLYPHEAGVRREKPLVLRDPECRATLNAHLRIPEHMIEAGYTLAEFRASLDRHVFFWPTVRDCRKMWETYSKREPEETFAILACDAHALLLNHYRAAKLSKYDSGSAPRFPHLCTYKKSPDMFLPLSEFGCVLQSNVPGKASEIREFLVEDKIINLVKYMQAVYVTDFRIVPENWRALAKPVETLWGR
ncbi:DUF7002 family protein [Cohnella nanjingensis]|uniref:DUF4433 domain-containing protein n=1 Tax=Cohnella nanjingensis TaxID=1387779 RepID=A0A7X0RKM4_9BACL|nr:hypothetical protein [Cohnella nanjingensis]MBB6669096.1 hypothetical protein [Cohnella nanjingensis]